MDAKLLQRVMDLAEKTGDRVIIVNPKSGTAHAVVPFDAYEKMAEGTASLRDLGDGFDFMESDVEDECELSTESGINLEAMPEDLSFDEPEVVIKVETPKAVAPRPEAVKEPASVEEIIEKMTQESQKEASGLTPLDVLDDEANEEQYYLEPLE